MFGCNNKRRFSLKYPDGRIERFGSCDPKEDDGRNIEFGNGETYLMQSQAGFAFVPPKLLHPDTLWTNGYYESEHDGWKPLSEWK